MTGTGTITARRLGPDDWAVWRDIRLTALADAPYAFGSSLARERDLTEADWRLRLAPGNGVTVVALLGDRVVGAAGGYTPPGTESVLLIAVWAHPDVRGHGAGDVLVDEVLAWARETGWSEVRLRVADGNDAARRLFVRHGFRPTGQRDTLESNPSAYTEALARKV